MPKRRRSTTDPKAVLLQSEYRVLHKALISPQYFARHEKRVMAIMARLHTTFVSYEPYKVAQAIREYHHDGEVEIDDGAVCSRGEDAGCYVQAWVWCYDEEGK